MIIIMSLGSGTGSKQYTSSDSYSKVTPVGEDLDRDDSGMLKSLVSMEGRKVDLHTHTQAAPALSSAHAQRLDCRTLYLHQDLILIFLLIIIYGLAELEMSVIVIFCGEGKVAVEYELKAGDIDLAFSEDFERYQLTFSYCAGAGDGDTRSKMPHVLSLRPKAIHYLESSVDSYSSSVDPPLESSVDVDGKKFLKV